MDLVIRPAAQDDQDVLELLQEHARAMHEASPPGLAYVLDAQALFAGDTSVFAAWEGAILAGLGALRVLDAESCELKSMRTARTHLRRGVGATMLRHLIVTAHARGCRRIFLETGSGPHFLAALALYQKFGFARCEAFGEYAPSAFNQFFCLEFTKEYCDLLCDWRSAT